MRRTLSTKTTAFAATLSLAAGFAAATWLGFDRAIEADRTDSETDAGFDSTAPIAARIAALEQAVGDERLARQLLQEEVFYLTSELEHLRGSGIGGDRDDEQLSGARDDNSQSPSDGRRFRDMRTGRRELLVEAGFLPSRADWITQREQELQMQALQARFDAERSGEPVDWMANRTLVSDTLREELGDAEYEQFLEATNRPTKISVSSVIESSPAQTAGLQPGDEIIRYGGERVFSMTDLTRQTMVGEPGQSVVVDIMRDGNLMQVVMPRGPVGITGGRRRY